MPHESQIASQQPAVFGKGLLSGGSITVIPSCNISSFNLDVSDITFAKRRVHVVANSHFAVGYGIANINESDACLTFC
ncbi:hypothetical protein D3C73_581100 [compost metagenome]